MNEYICNICDYNTVRKHNYDRHILSKHHKKRCLTENGNKIILYKCLSCGYSFSLKNNYKRHIMKCVTNNDDKIESTNIVIVSAQKKNNTEKWDIKNEQLLTSSEKNSKYIYECKICCFSCKKKSNYDKHLKCKKHIQNKKIVESCDNININTTNIDIFKTEVVKTLMGQLSSILEDNHKNILSEQYKMNQKITEIANKPSSHIYNNNTKQNNQQFNMNVFLNETCKDAMNMSDFIENLHVSMEDMEKTGELGFAKGMSRIIMNNLNAIDVCKRPIHCSDAKRETLYVKNNGVWEKETEERIKIKEVIYKVSCLNERQLIKWRDLPRNKGYHLSDHLKNDEFMNLVMEINKMRDEEIDKVITTISKHVAIDKVKMSGYLN
jgi:hypothetical protein